jgi:hypothetical protein
VQKIKGAYDIRLRRKIYINPQSNVLDNSNNQTLKDVKHLQKIFAKNPKLCPLSFVCMSHLSFMNVCIVNDASCGPFD